MLNSFLLFFVLFVVLRLCSYVDNKKTSLPSYFICDNLILCKDVLSLSNTSVYRGYAILIIMLCHIAGCWNFVGFTPFGGIGVAMFLFLSGYGLNESWKKNGLKSFWKKKVVRVIFPYVVFRMIWLMIDGSILDGSAYFSIVNCSHSSFWYIDYLVRCYIAFYISNKLLNGKYKLLLLLLFAIYSFLCLSSLCAEQAFSFLVGVIVSERKRVIDCVPFRKVCFYNSFLLLLGIGCLALKQLSFMRDLSNTHWFLLCELGIKLPLGISFMTLLYLMRNMVNSQVIVMFGTISLELYLIHIWLVKYIVKDSVFQGLALIIVSTLLAYSFNKMCNYCTNLLVAYKRNDNAN